MSASLKTRLLVVLCLAAFAVASILAYNKYKESDDEADDPESIEAVEVAADVANPQTIDRPGFLLQHPGNWEMDIKDPDYVADHVFWMDTPGQSWVLFIVNDEPSDPAENVQEELADLAKDLDLGDLAFAERSNFTQWGAYLGTGLQLKHISGDETATARFFSFSSGKKSFVVVERYADADLPLLQPGLDMVRSTFKLKE